MSGPIDKKRYKKAFNVNEMSVKEINLNEPGSYGVFLDNYSGDLELIVGSSEVKLDVWGRYVGKQGDKLDLDLSVIYEVGGSSSKILIRGVAYEGSAINVNGKIAVNKDCDGVEATMNIDGILESDSGKIGFLPKLDIASNDVVCRHGATVGRISEEQIDYLRSRGIAEDEARELLIEGFLAETSLRPGLAFRLL